MRVLTFIARFLGISAILLFLASFAFADDVTVNFPDNMNVTGTVEIDPGNYGGVDLQGDTLATGDDIRTGNQAFDGNGGLQSSTSFYYGRIRKTSTTYIKYLTLNLSYSFRWFSFHLGNSITELVSEDYSISLPSLDFDSLLTDVKSLFFGDTTNTTIFKFMDGIRSGRSSNINNNLGFKVTDFTGSNSWEIDVKTPYAFITGNPLYPNSSVGMSAFITPIVVCFLWFEVAISIINTVKQG